MGTRGFTRRDFVRLQLYGSAWVAMGGLGGLACNRKQGRDTGTKVIALGLDGMDPNLVSRMRLVERLNAGLRSGRKLTLVSSLGVPRNRYPLSLLLPPLARSRRRRTRSPGTTSHRERRR